MPDTRKTERAKQVARVIARAWTDPDFKKQLKKDPVTTLRKAGLKVPAGVKVQVHENTPKSYHWVIPNKPARAISEEDLAKHPKRHPLCMDACCSG